MEQCKQFVLSIVICVLCCGIVSCMITGTKRKRIIRLICGTAISVTMLYPLTEIKLEDFSDFLSDYSDSAEIYVSLGQQRAQSEKERYIKDASEAYISNMAAKFDAVVEANILLDENQVPSFVQIQGCITPEVKEELGRILEVDMGITKENQEWILNLESSSS